MPEYILYDSNGKKHTLLHMIDVRTALATGLYSAERPLPDKKKVGRPSIVEKPQFNKVEIETNRTPDEKIRDKVKTKSDIEKMEEKAKGKKS